MAEYIAKAVTSVAIAAAVAYGVHKTKSAWCLWGLWLAYGIWYP